MAHDQLEHEHEREPPTRRHLAGVTVVLLTGAWLGLGWAYLARPTTPGHDAAASLDYQVHINHDPAVRLQLLSGIGPRLAERIVTRREQQGPFANVHELNEVRFVGPRLLDRIEPWLRFTPPAVDESAVEPRD